MIKDTPLSEAGVTRDAAERVSPFLVHERRRADLARHYLPKQYVLWPGNKCTLLRDGVEAFPAMIEAIRGAQRSIRLCVYMFIDDPVGDLFARELSAAAGRGVEVTVFYDALGSFWTARSFFQRMRDAGVVVRAFKPFSLKFFRSMVSRDHRKLLVVDGELAFTGGMNVAAMWAPLAEDGGGWRDDVLRIEGPVVQQLERRFSATWRLHVNQRLVRFRELLHRRRTRPLRYRGDTALAVLSTRRGIYRAYLHAIENARKSIQIANAYFVPDRRMVQALRDAAARGVKVELLVNARWDHPLLHHVSRAFYDRLLPSGIQIYEWCSGVLHAKTAVVDGIWGTVGSFNLERTSFRLNHEMNVAFADARLASKLAESFARDTAQCKPVLLGDWQRRPRWQKALERFLYLFRKLV